MDKIEQALTLIEEFINASTTDANIQQGESLYNNNVVTLKGSDKENDTFRFMVRDSKYYKTEVYGIYKGSVRTSCSCPFSFGVLCKHSVAALKYLIDNIYKLDGFAQEGARPIEVAEKRHAAGVELVNVNPLRAGELKQMATGNTINRVVNYAFLMTCTDIIITPECITFKTKDEYRKDSVEIRKVEDLFYVSSTQSTASGNLNSIELYCLLLIANSDIPQMIAGVFAEENMPFQQDLLSQYGLDKGAPFTDYFNYVYDEDKGLHIVADSKAKGLMSADELADARLARILKPEDDLKVLNHLPKVDTLQELGFVLQAIQSRTGSYSYRIVPIIGKTNKTKDAIINSIDVYHRDSNKIKPSDNQRELLDLIHQFNLDELSDSKSFAAMQKAFRLMTNERFIYHADTGFYEFKKRDLSMITLSSTPIDMTFDVSVNSQFVNSDMKIKVGKLFYKHEDLSQKYVNPYINSINNIFYFSKNERVGECLTSLPSELKMVLAQKEEFYRRVVAPLSKDFVINFNEGSYETEVIELDFNEKELYLTEKDGYVVFTPQVVYQDDMSVLLHKNGNLLDKTDQLVKVYKRNFELEDDYIDMISKMHPQFETQKSNRIFFLHMSEFTDNMWFYKFFDHLQVNNIEVFGLKDLKGFKYSPYQGNISTSVTSRQDWFEVNIQVSFGDNQIGLAEIKKAVLKKERYIQLNDGSVGIMPKEWFTKLEKYFRNSEIKDNSLAISKLRFSIVDDLFDEIDDFKVIQEITEKRERLKAFTEITDTEVPDNITAELRHYQKEGLNWLNFLDEMQWGGILADDMGLGKTLQILTFIQHVVRKENSTNLIVVPTTLLFNWENEIAKFAPDLKAFYYYGSNRQKDTSVFKDYDLVFTTYGILLRDIEVLKDFRFNYVILDESQAIKNPASRRFKAAKLIQANNRIAMSGTPIENGTFDLYAQMSFVNPGFFAAASSFKENYAFPIDRDGDENIASELQKVVNPFILRRTKERVATELPSKTEDVIYCEMEPKQRSVYDAYRNNFKEKLLNKIDEQGLAKSKIMVLEALTRLRQICDSPLLINDENVTEAQSIKIKEILRHITHKTTDHKILVFSQFVKMLDLVKIELNKLNIKYEYLDGKSSPKQREQSVDNFQTNGELRVFLISLKAGGTGLNLTAADYVYLLDPWWNPAVENQAIDRCYRIGQDKKVFAYRMICKNTIEEKIVKLQNQKKKIAGDIIQTDENIMKTLDMNDIEELFS
ncbi:DEAD/DEAH box helicase [Saccharicrinis aurantiacus]|uniref:DEAD/DEAH box helicase n=1 Tax=Saccharicrinis aurantiacus TaxID=1849719 RepID=UPI0024917B27|nr:DEAD/DEAH box helicase [Saccharicrinis aurantiacus]